MRTRPHQTRTSSRTRPPQTTSDHIRPPQTTSDHIRPPQTTSDQDKPPPPPEDMHCGYFLLLLPGLWAGLTAGAALRDGVDVQSIIEDLEKELVVYSNQLNRTDSVRDLQAPPCNRAAAHLDQSDALVDVLSFYPSCAGRLRALCPDVTALCRAITLNHDLLEHLVDSHLDSDGCPSPPVHPPSRDYNSMIESVQCVQCWRQQVAALRR